MYFFHKKLLSKKNIKPCYQTVLRRKLNIKQAYWKQIYQCKICDMPDKRLAEFNYKLLNNILCNKAFLGKCKQDTHSQCNMCMINEFSKHLIFECKNVIEIWNALDTFLKTNITWKHVIVVFNYESNRKVITLITLISYVAYRIYKYKMYCRLQC